MIATLDPRISEVLTTVERKWGRGALVRLGDAAEQAEVEAIPTGFPALDAATGIGGLPCGRISEIFGPDSSGKQALAAHLVVQCQREEGVAAYLDLSGRLDPEEMRAQGVDFGSLLVIRPKGELQALEMAIRLARGGGVRLMVLDSAPSTQHSALDLALRRLVAAVDRNGIAFVFLSDVEQGGPGAFNPVGGEPRRAAGDKPLPCRHSAGGTALRFFASMRLGMERSGWIRRGRDVAGCRSIVRVVKNKLAPPLKEAEVELLFYRFPPDAPALQICRPGDESGSLRDISYGRSLALQAGR